MKKRRRTGLALGRGGDRGLAHLGVLKALERQDIPIDLIVGTSIGALVGAAYAVDPDALTLERRVEEILGPEGQHNTGLKRLGRLHRDNVPRSGLLNRLARIAEKEMFLSRAMFGNAMLSENDMRECIEVCTDIGVGETTIPYAATAVDLVSGRQVVLKDGSLVRAVMAGYAVPGFIPAVRWEEMILIDGAVYGGVPAGPTKDEGADVVIAVDVGSCFCRPNSIEDGIDVINRAAQIMSFYMNRQSREKADVVIEPDVKQIEWSNFHNYEELIYEGEKAAELKIEKTREILERRFTKRMLRWPRKLLMGRERKPIKGNLSDRAKGCLLNKPNRPEK